MNKFGFRFLITFLIAAMFHPSWTQGFVHIRTTTEIPVRDTGETGKGLASDIYLPAEEGDWPAILIQTPFGKFAF